MSKTKRIFAAKRKLSLKHASFLFNNVLKIKIKAPTINVDKGIKSSGLITKSNELSELELEVDSNK